jgi:hypothetical protein
LKVWKNSSCVPSLPPGNGCRRSQQVDVAVFPPEGRQLVLLPRLDEFVGERLAGGVAHRALAALQQRLAHRLDQMRLARPVPPWMNSGL